MLREHHETPRTNKLPELLNIHNAFHQGQYTTVIDFDISSLSSENKIPARVLQLRAQVAAGQAKEVLADIGKEGNAPDFAAVKAFAQYSLGSTSNAVSNIESLVQTESENTTVQLLGGAILQAAGNTDEALSLLSKHQGSLEVYEIQPSPFHSPLMLNWMLNDLLHRIALIVQIHLQQNRTDLALKEVQAARKWAQDSLLVNIAESWVGLRMVCYKLLTSISSLVDEADLSLLAGRRTLPTSLLRLRRNGPSTFHLRNEITRWSSCRRATFGSITGSRGSIAAGSTERSK